MVCADSKDLNQPVCFSQSTQNYCSPLATKSADTCTCTGVLQKALSLGSDNLLQCYVLSNIFLLQTFKSIPPLLKHIFVTFLPSREKQINSLHLVTV